MDMTREKMGQNLRGKPRKPASVTSKPDSGPVVVVAMQLSEAHLRVLEEEAAAVGWRRGQLMLALLQNRIGKEMAMTRKSTRVYDDITEKELSTITSYHWHTTPRGKAEFLSELKAIGNPQRGVLAVRMIEAWIGAELRVKGSRPRD